MVRKKATPEFIDPAADLLSQVIIDKTSTQEVEDDGDKPVPLPTSPEWSDYVLEQFEPDEMMDGNPTVPGLRRVAQLLIGEISRVQFTVFERAVERVGSRYVAWAVVGCEITFERGNGPKLIGDLASVTPDNTDPEFARYAVETASTRAEGRVLRKALNLRRVIAAEEATLVPIGFETESDGMISKQQINHIDTLCQRNNINVISYINSGQVQYKSVRDITEEKAVSMIRYLSELQRKQDTIPEALRGYQENWQK